MWWAHIQSIIYKFVWSRIKIYALCIKKHFKYQIVCIQISKYTGKFWHKIEFCRRLWLFFTKESFVNRNYFCNDKSDFCKQSKFCQQKCLLSCQKLLLLTRLNFVNRNYYNLDKTLVLCTKVNFVDRNDFCHGKRDFCVQKWILSSELAFVVTKVTFVSWWKLEIIFVVQNPHKSQFCIQILKTYVSHLAPRIKKDRSLFHFFIHMNYNKIMCKTFYYTSTDFSLYKSDSI
jgi:hypothetical protein